MILRELRYDLDTENKFTSITLNGEKITDKKIAGASLLMAMSSVKTDTPTKIGEYRGFYIIFIL